MVSQQSKGTILFLALLLAALLVSGCGSTNTAVGILDVEKVMADSPKVKQMQEQLNVKGKALSDQLEKEKPGISDEEYQKRQQAAYGEFLKMKQDLETEIDNSIKQALDQTAKDKKLGIILYKSGVAHGGTDITEDVVKKMQ